MLRFSLRVSGKWQLEALNTNWAPSNPERGGIAPEPWTFSGPLFKDAQFV